MKTTAKKELNQLKKEITLIYDLHGQATAIDWVNQFNKNHIAQIPFEYCKGCEAESPSLLHECCLCGQATQRMSDNDIAIRGKKAIGFKNESEWQKCATDKDKARLEGFILGAKFGLSAKF